MLIPPEKIEAAALFIKSKAVPDLRIDIGIVLGTGFADLAGQFEPRGSFRYRDIPGFPVPGVDGHPGVLILTKHEAKSVAILQGRTHLYEGLDVRDMMLPIAVLRSLACGTILLTNAAGGLDPAMVPGDLMVISDHINMTGYNPLVGERDESGRVRFLDARNLYDAQLRKDAMAIAEEDGIPLRQGVYVGVVGPSYETPAEARAFRNLGADAVGMSTVIEALFARHLGMRVFGVSCISNVLALDKRETMAHSSITDVVSHSLPKAAAILAGLIR